MAAQTGTMSGAAKVLGVPTSTVSRSIARLEKHLDILLIRRGQHGIVLTDAGTEYLPSCLEALRLLQSGHEALTNRFAEPTGTVRVACPITMAREVLAPLLPQFGSEFAEVKVDILSYVPGELISPDDTIDVFFHLWPLKFKAGMTRQFPSTRRGIYTSKRYAELAGVPQTPEDLRSFQCIGSKGIPIFAKWKLQNGSRVAELELEYRFTAADPPTLRKMLLEGLGITMLPVWMALEDGTKEHLIRILADWEPTPVDLFATCPGGEPLLPKVNAFLGFLEKHIGTSSDPRAIGKATEKCFSLS